MKFLVWIILCLIWGTTWMFIKVGLEEIPPFRFAFIRFALSILIVGSIIYFAKIPLPRRKEQWRLLAITGVLQFSINYALVFWSELHISSGLAAVLQATIPVFGLILAAVYIPEEKITRLKIAALAMGVCGVSIIFYEQLRIENFYALAGAAAIVIGAYAAAHASILTKAKGGGMHPAILLFGQMICGIGPLFLISAFSEGISFDTQMGIRGIASILYLAIFGTVISFWLYYWLLSRIESTKAMTIALVTPFIAVVCGNIVLGESLRARTIGGGLLVMASVGLIIFRTQIRRIFQNTSGQKI